MNKLSLTLLVVVVCLCLVQQSDAWWGRGFGFGGGLGFGRGFGYRGFYGAGLGYPSYGLGYGYGYSGLYSPYYSRYCRDTNDDRSSRMQCVYISSKSVLGCKMPSSEIIECDATANFTTLSQSTNSIFGIGKKQAKDESIEMSLHPRSKDLSLWLDSKLFHKDKMVKLAIHQKLAKDMFGIRIHDANCYNELMKQMDLVENLKKVKIGDDMKSKIQSSNEVDIVGELVLAPQDIKLEEEKLEEGKNEKITMLKMKSALKN